MGNPSSPLYSTFLSPFPVFEYGDNFDIVVLVNGLGARSEEAFCSKCDINLHYIYACLTMVTHHKLLTV